MPWLPKSKSLSQRETLESRPHQRGAVDNAVTVCAVRDCGKLIMTSGNGKTFTALRLAERVAEENGGKVRIPFLVIYFPAFTIPQGMDSTGRS